MNSSTFLGQPLRANIQLVNVEQDVDLSSLIIRQMAPDEAVKMGVEAFPINNRINFVVDESSGQPQILVSSEEPVNEPYLSLVIEVRWSKGVLFREYPLLLDLPPVRPVDPVPIPTVKERPTTDLPTTNTAPRSTPSAPRPVVSQIAEKRAVRPKSAPQVVNSTDSQYQVKSGDTLSAIARKWRNGTTESTQSTMSWVHQNNPHAFTQNDPNRLVAGAVLQMPNLSSSRRLDANQDAPPSLAPLSSPESQEKTMPEMDAKNDEAISDGPSMAPADEDKAQRGLLTVTTDNRDDKTRELIDMLVKENEHLKARMEKVERSEYLDTLQKLILLQRQQISDLRKRVGVPDTDASAEMDELLLEVGAKRGDYVPENSNGEQTETPNTKLSDPLISKDKALVDLDPVIAQPIQKVTERSQIKWWLLGAAGLLSVLFIGLFAYYRRMLGTPTPDAQVINPPRTSPKISAYPSLDDQPNLSTPITLALSDEPVTSEVQNNEQLTVIAPKKLEDENHWMGEKVESIEALEPLDPMDFQLAELDATIKEVQDNFSDLVLDEDAIKNFIVSEDEFVDEPLKNTDATLIQNSKLNQNLQPSSEKPDSKKSQKSRSFWKGSQDATSRRPDDEVKMAIAEKMAQYNPEDFRQEVDYLGLMELDDLDAQSESEEAVDTVVYRAMMFCEFRRFDRAKHLLETKMATTQDERLSGALQQVMQLEADAESTNKKAM